MTDARLRGFERQASTGGDAEARARLIIERLRAGRLEPDHVRLAAHGGDPGARLALGHAGCVACDGHGALPGAAVGRPGEVVACAFFPAFEPWVRGLAAAGPGPLRRAAVAAVLQALRVQGVAARLTLALDRWRDDPSPDAEAAVLRLAGAGEDATRRLAATIVADPAQALLDVAQALSSEVAVRAAVAAELGRWLLPDAPPAAES